MAKIEFLQIGKIFLTYPEITLTLLTPSPIHPRSSFNLIIWSPMSIVRDQIIKQKATAPEWKCHEKWHLPLLLTLLH